jgi:hypothetical protein
MGKSLQFLIWTDAKTDRFLQYLLVMLVFGLLCGTLVLQHRIIDDILAAASPATDLLAGALGRTMLLVALSFAVLAAANADGLVKACVDTLKRIMTARRVLRFGYGPMPRILSSQLSYPDSSR